MMSKLDEKKACIKTERVFLDGSRRKLKRHEPDLSKRRGGGRLINLTWAATFFLDPLP